MFAVVTIAGKQYQVNVGDTLLVDKIDGKVGDTVTFDHVLLTNDKGKTSIGTPIVPRVKVKAKIITQEKGEKIDVRRFKSKVRYRRAKGFRSQMTRIQILTIA